MIADRQPDAIPAQDRGSRPVAPGRGRPSDQGGGGRQWAAEEGLGRELLAFVIAGIDRAAPPVGEAAAGGSPTGRGRGWRIVLGGRPAWVKQHLHGGMTGRLLSLIPGGEAQACFPAAGRLQRSAGVALRFLAAGGRTAAPLAWLARGRVPCLRLYSASAEIPGAVTLDVPLRNSKGKERCRLVASLGAAIAGWHAAGLVHPDLNLGNILVTTPPGAAPAPDHFAVIDLDRARLIEPVSMRRRAAALSRLERSAARTLGAEGLRGPDRRRLAATYVRAWHERQPSGGTAPRRLARLRRALARRRRLFGLHGLRPA